MWRIRILNKQALSKLLLLRDIRQCKTDMSTIFERMHRFLAHIGDVTFTFFFFFHFTSSNIKGNLYSYGGVIALHGGLHREIQHNMTLTSRWRQVRTLAKC